MPDAPDYQKIVEMVDAADSAYGGESETIDVNTIFSNRIEIKKLRYAQVSALLEKGGVIPEMPEVQPAAQQVQVQVPRQELGKERASAAAKLKGMVGGAGKEFEEEVKKKVETSAEAGLIMPTLSLQDQISELEKISVGLDSSSFSPEELKIIRMEVVGLVKRKKPAPSDDFQKNLASMRDVRLKDVSRKLGL